MKFGCRKLEKVSKYNYYQKNSIRNNGVFLVFLPKSPTIAIDSYYFKQKKTSQFLEKFCGR